jgi:uncharacterized protein
VVGDGELVGASLGGSSVAFAVLVTRHRERARRVARRLLGDAHEAEDVTQEALLQAYVGLAALRDRERFGAWLAAIAANLARMRLRRTGDVPVPTEELDERAAAEDAGVLEHVRLAIAVLPPAEREAFLACEVLGLSREEAGRALGCSAVAVRVRLHRARGRLREELREHVPQITKKEREMIEMEIRDIVIRGDDNGGLTHRTQPVVLLAEKGGDRVLPIWIGPPEAGALVLRLAEEETPRPMSADLMARLVEALGGRVERVTVSSLRDDTFFAAIALEGPAGRVEVDARPSDALNLALRFGAPVYADEGVVEQAGLTDDALDAKLDREEERVTGRATEGGWESISAERVRGWFRAAESPPQADQEEGGAEE